MWLFFELAFCESVAHRHIHQGKPQKNDWANVSEICECEVEDQYGYFTDISFTGASGTLANCNMIIDHLAHRTNISLKLFHFVTNTFLHFDASLQARSWLKIVDCLLCKVDNYEKAS